MKISRRASLSFALVAALFLSRPHQVRSENGNITASCQVDQEMYAENGVINAATTFVQAYSENHCVVKAIDERYTAENKNICSVFPLSADKNEINVSMIIDFSLSFLLPIRIPEYQSYQETCEKNDGRICAVSLDFMIDMAISDVNSSIKYKFSSVIYYFPACVPNSCSENKAFLIAEKFAIGNVLKQDSFRRHRRLPQSLSHLARKVEEIDYRCGSSYVGELEKKGITIVKCTTNLTDHGTCDADELQSIGKTSASLASSRGNCCG